MSTKTKVSSNNQESIDLLELFAAVAYKVPEHVPGDSQAVIRRIHAEVTRLKSWPSSDLVERAFRETLSRMAAEGLGGQTVMEVANIVKAPQPTEIKITTKGPHWPWTVKGRMPNGKWRVLFTCGSLKEAAEILASRGTE